ncbi:hypothetical protein LFWB_2710 [Candidatus Phytoplasma luffae]|uniref:Uncharacterized protein n=1 Tax=Loofah witches'-broom phytoplasma TaxID=35773 RepID=A0A975ING8_LOWBP|nr:hypothetical protein LFWB_2710 [Candidatus Phytoplasma luffae]
MIIKFLFIAFILGIFIPSLTYLVYIEKNIFFYLLLSFVILFFIVAELILACLVRMIKLDEINICIQNKYP